MQFHRFILKNANSNTRSFKEFIQRSLYTSEQLHIEEYIKERNYFRSNLQKNSLAMTKENIQKNVNQPKISSNIIVNDLNTLIHLIENTSNDFKLLENVIEKFKCSSNLIDLRKSSIGAILMKALHHFQQDQLADKFYSDPALKPFFMGKLANLIFFDLLYKREEYSKLLKYFDSLRKELESKEQLITRSIYVIAFATCYNQNTRKSFEYAKELHDQYNESHITQSHLIYLSALAINQKEPNFANEYLQSMFQRNHVAVPNLRLLAAVQLQQFNEALKIFRSIVIVCDDNYTPKVDVFAKEVIDKVDKLFSKCQDNDQLDEYQKLRINLNKHGYIVEKSLNALVAEPVIGSMTKRQQTRMTLDIAFKKIKRIS